MLIRLTYSTKRAQTIFALIRENSGMRHIIARKLCFRRLSVLFVVAIHGCVTREASTDPTYGRELQIAAIQGDEQAIRRLVASGLDPDQLPKSGPRLTALDEAFRAQNMKSVKVLLELGADGLQGVDAPTNPVGQLIHAGDEDLLQQHLSRHSISNKIDPTGRLPIQIAVDSGNVKMVRAVLSAGGIVDTVVDESLRTPLFRAVESRKSNVVETLLSLGANPDTPDIHGQSPRQLAMTTKDRELIAMFSKTNDKGH